MAAALPCASELWSKIFTCRQARCCCVCLPVHRLSPPGRSGTHRCFRRTLLDCLIDQEPRSLDYYTRLIDSCGKLKPNKLVWQWARIRESQPARGLSANQIARALISMMARSTRSNQRSDTLMQDRIGQSRQTSCTARPDHTSGHL
jgi:hypothetical protein